MEHKPLGTTNAGTLLDRIDVGRVMSWYEYEARAKQEGGRLPTAAELEHDGISLSYDQWTPVIPSAVDSQTGRDDGLTADDVSKLMVRMQALEARFAGEQHRARQLQKENHQLKQEIAQLRRNGVKGLQARK